VLRVGMRPTLCVWWGGGAVSMALGGGAGGRGKGGGGGACPAGAKEGHRERHTRWGGRMKRHTIRTRWCGWGGVGWGQYRQGQEAVRVEG
jgi:hypothetical protein